MDNVNHPQHYSGNCSIECIDAMLIAFGVEAVVNFCKCNAFKYLWRFKNKNGLEDLDKALWYLKQANILCCDSDDEKGNEQITTLLGLVLGERKKLNGDNSQK